MRRRVPTWNDRAGINVGGPLRIPHVYDGSDRTFFYVNYETSRARNGINTLSTVPTAFERQNPGDFCDRPNTQLYVPTRTPAKSIRTSELSVGCQIPSNMLNQSSSLALLNYAPLPNVPGAGLVDNYNLLTRIPAATNVLNTRITHTISAETQRADHLQPQPERWPQHPEFPGVRERYGLAGASRSHLWPHAAKLLAQMDE